MKRSIIKTLVLVVLVLVFALSLVSQSQAQKIKPIVLKGTYGVIGHDVCVGHWIVHPNAPAPLTYWTKTTTLQGIVTFKPDLTGAGEVNQVTIIHPIYTPIPSFSYWVIPVPETLPFGDTSTTHISTTFTYSIDPVTRVITREVSGSGQITSGSNKGKFITFDTYTLTGYVSLDTGTIVGSSPVDISPDQADYTRMVYYFNDSGHTSPYGQQEEVCQRTRVSTLIK
jgi:hypothetical protein